MAINYPQRYDDDFLNTIKTVIDHVNVHGKAIQDLVAEGQLTDEQYAELIRVVNSLVKSGEVGKEDLDPGFRSELEKINAQLAQKTNYAYVDNKLQQVASGAPKITASTLNELESLYPNGSENNALVTNSGHVYTWDGSEWIDTGILYQAAGIARGSVSQQETTFARKGKNIFSGKYDYGYAVIGSDEGGYAFAEREGAVSVVLEIETNKTFSISWGGEPDQMGVYGYTVNPFDNILRAPDASFHTKGNIPGDKKITVSPSGEYKYIVIYVSSANESIVPDWFQVEYGEPSSYEPPTVVNIDLADETVLDLKSKFGKVNPNDTTFAKTNNLFNGEYVYGYSVVGSSSDGFTLVKREGAIGIIQRMALNPGDVFSVSFEGDNNRLGVFAFDEDPLQLIGGSPSFVFRTGDLEAPSSKQVTFESEGTYEYLFILLSSPSQSVKPNQVQIEYGPPSGSPNSVDIALTNKAMDRIVEYLPNNKPNSLNIPTYVPTIEPIDYLSIMNSVHDVYAKYDELVDSFGQYVSRTELGKETTGLPLYRYDFKPTVPLMIGHRDGIENFRTPKILIFSGIHGMEKMGVHSTLMFFMDLCHNWQINESLEKLRQNIHFVVIPSVNPFGYNATTVANANNVDINRNFPTGHTITDQPGQRFGGYEPLTEIETQLMANLMANEQDVIFAVDVHNSNSVETDRTASYFASYENNMSNRFFNAANNIDGKIRQKFPSLANWETGLIGVHRRGEEKEGARLSREFPGYGLNGVLLENTAGWSGGSENDSRVVGTLALGGLLAEAANIFYRY